MNNSFYPRLAVTNLRNNHSIYRPYLLASTLIVALFYILTAITEIVATSNAKGNENMAIILGLSAVVCGILSIVVLFYINSFVIKRRQKEFGLYSILGMEKRHITIVMGWEVLISGGFSIFAGIAGGALFSQLLFLILLKIIHMPAQITFQISPIAIVSTLLLFGFGFILVYFYDLVMIHRANAVTMLRSAKQGEHEPKARWLLALFGVATLGCGYLLALTAKTPADAFNRFFPAVLLVIAGTYLLFLAGSIAVLKLLKRCKGFYYRPENFISISGMLYRMKQNAAGLANICILSTCVLVTLSSTVCLFIGEEEILKLRYPREVNVSCLSEEAGSDQLMQQAAARHAEKTGFRTENAYGYYAFTAPVSLSENMLSYENLHTSQTIHLTATTLDDYCRLTGSDVKLDSDEILLAVTGSEPPQTASIDLFGNPYRIQSIITPPEFLDKINFNVTWSIVVPNYSDLELLQKPLGENNAYALSYIYWFDAVGDPENRASFLSTLREEFNKTVPHLAVTASIDSSRNDFYQLYGTLLFVGIFFVTLFLIATVLIIYYKQITEGFDDHDRFHIMKNVGMSDLEVRKTISKQVLLVFFLPLGMAVLHIAVAFPVLCKLLAMFNLYNMGLFLGCTIVSCILFSALYFLVYRLTARTYYQIVQA